mgnify:CR=1 FL=1
MSSPTLYARRWQALLVLAFSLLVISVGNTILNVALPTLQDEFDASPSKLQWMVDSYLLVFAGLLLVFGTLGDRFGRKLALQAGLLLFGGGSLAVLAVQSAGQLIAVRAALGVAVSFRAFTPGFLTATALAAFACVALAGAGLIALIVLAAG